MEIKNLLIENCKSSSKLTELYNIWQKETQFLSTGNMETKTWNDLIKYAKDNINEAISFALEYLMDDSSNWIILSFIDEVIGSPIDLHKTEYINPNTKEIKEIYIFFLKALIDDEIDGDEIDLNEIKIIFPAKDFNVWYSTNYDKNIRPLDGEMVLYSVWYDGPNYGIGMYDKDTDELILHDNRLLEDCTRLTFDDFDVWMMFHEPNFKM